MIDDGSAKLGDFGCSVECKSGLRKTLCGTKYYHSPAIINKQKYGKPADMWTLGILCYELLVGIGPFHSDDSSRIFKMIKNDDVCFPEFVSECAKDFIRGLLQKQQSNRLTIKEALEHDFLMLEM